LETARRIATTSSPRLQRDDIGFVGARESVIRGVGGQNPEPARAQVVRIDHASDVWLDEQDRLLAWQRDLPFWNGAEATVRSAASPVSHLRRL
jgi:hypothetical protein